MFLNLRLPVWWCYGFPNLGAGHKESSNLVQVHGFTDGLRILPASHSKLSGESQLLVTFSHHHIIIFPNYKIFWVTLQDLAGILYEHMHYNVGKDVCIRFTSSKALEVTSQPEVPTWQMLLYLLFLVPEQSIWLAVLWSHQMRSWR